MSKRVNITTGKRKKADEMWSSRSGPVVTRRIEEEAQTPPPPSVRQQCRQDKWI